MSVNGEEIKVAAIQLKKVIIQHSAKGHSLKLKVIKLFQPSLICSFKEILCSLTCLMTKPEQTDSKAFLHYYCSLVSEEDTS